MKREIEAILLMIGLFVSVYTTIMYDDKFLPTFLLGYTLKMIIQ